MNEKIVEFLKQHPYPVSEEELFVYLMPSSSSEDIKAINQSLEQLIRDHCLLSLSDGSLALSSAYLLGTITFRHNGTVFFLPKGEGEKREVCNACQMPCLNKDLVYLDPKTNAIVKIAEHKTTLLTGIIRRDRRGVRFLPDIDLPKGYHVINMDRYPLKDRTVVAARIQSYERKEMVITEVIGRAGDLQCGIRGILYVNQVDPLYPSDALKQAERLDRKVDTNHFPGYKNLEDFYTVTIDGDDSKDFDDAISIKKEKDDTVLYVHIADVAHYVEEGSYIDEEALKRATSVYYPGGVVSMLPERLSNDLCSLNPGELRPTITVELHYNLEGVCLFYQIYPALIRSKARLTYRQVNAFFNHDVSMECEDFLDSARELACKLQTNRARHGAISFKDSESIFEIKDNEILSVRERESGEAEKLIESFMIEANVAVATFLHQSNLPAIYRNHDVPDALKMESFLNEVAKLGYHFDKSKDELSAKDLAECLDFFAGQACEPAVQDRLLRSMAKALYSERCEGHFALSLSDYCHFTSPIRRYPDLFVHRMLHAYLFKDMKLSDHQDKKAVLFAQKSNDGEMKATGVEREVDQYLKCLYMLKHIGEYYEGIISGLTSFGIFVKLPNTVEGLVPIRHLSTYFELMDDGSLSDGETVYRIGDRVRIKVAEVDKLKKTIDFRLVHSKKGIIESWA